MKVIVICCLLVAIILSVVVAVSYFSVQRDVVGWQNRARVAADAERVHENMEKIKEGMETWGMTSGYARYIWKTPDYNMAEIYKAVSAITERAEKMIAVDSTTIAYQLALDNLRETIVELDLHAWEYTWRHSSLSSVLFCWIFWIITVILIFYWGYLEDW